MKHCTTDKCPQILDSSCVFYEGTSLIFSGINTNDSVETVIQKLNLKFETGNIGVEDIEEVLSIGPEDFIYVEVNNSKKKIRKKNLFSINL